MTGYTAAVKTAVSIPTRLFEKAERRARQLGISRSKLYAQALEKLLRDDEEESELTRELNEVFKDVDASLDPAWKEHTARIVAKYWEW
jgi:metal-responsive CopG/Arc/MetJ family transcriptional regulator